MKAGVRQMKLQEDKKIKKHIKGFYSIMGEMESLSQELRLSYPDIEFTEENLNEYAQPIYGRDLDNMEMFLVLGKLHKEDGEDNT